MVIPSKTQVDRLGERFKSGAPDEADLRELDEYRRSFGDAFQEADRPAAENARLDLELSLNREGIEHEIVLLDAASEEALRRTHGRYCDVIEWPEGALPDQVASSSDG